LSILGVDVGGTFTDFLFWERGHLRIYKRPSTPADPSDGVIAGLREMAARPDDLVHGSTVATNALLERRGARTGLITTRGFKDVLVIGRQARPTIYDLHPTRPEPLVPDDLRLEIDERIDSEGAVLRAPSVAAIDDVLDVLCSRGVESLAISLLFSFAHPEHEQIVAERARARGLVVSASHEVLPEYREYERTSTTAVNAYVSPLMGRYLGRLETRTREEGVRRLRVMQSDGGSMSAETAARLAEDLGARAGLKKIKVEGATVDFTFTGERAELAALHRELTAAHEGLVSFYERRLTVEDVFLASGRRDVS